MIGLVITYGGGGGDDHGNASLGAVYYNNDICEWMTTASHFLPISLTTSGRCLEENQDGKMETVIKESKARDVSFASSRQQER